jgi:hypothetical protein
MRRSFTKFTKKPQDMQRLSLGLHFFNELTGVPQAAGTSPGRCDESALFTSHGVVWDACSSRTEASGLTLKSHME